MTLVREVMSRFVTTVGEDTTVAEATRLAAERDVCHLPVVESERLVGVVCLCDVARAGPDARVGDYMSAPVVTIDAREPLERAAETMKREGVGSLPVVAGGRLLGIVTREDLRREGLVLAGRGVGVCSCCGAHHHVWETDGAEMCADCRERARGKDPDERRGVVD